MDAANAALLRDALGEWPLRPNLWHRFLQPTGDVYQPPDLGRAVLTGVEQTDRGVKLGIRDDQGDFSRTFSIEDEKQRHEVMELPQPHVGSRIAAIIDA